MTLSNPPMTGVKNPDMIDRVGIWSTANTVFLCKFFYFLCLVNPSLLVSAYYQSWEVPNWDARSARAQSMTLGVVTMVTSIKYGVPYVCFSCHTWSSNGPFIAFLPFNVSTLVILLLGWTRVVVLAMAAVKGILFARGSPPNRSNWAKNRQCSNTQSERTKHNLPVMSTTSDFSSFGRRSSAFRQPRQILFTWHPMMAVKTLSTQEGTAGYLGIQSDKLQREWSVLSHTKLPKCGQNASFASLVWKAVLRRRMCKFYTADFQNSTAKRKENSLAKRSPLPKIQQITQALNKSIAEDEVTCLISNVYVAIATSDVKRASQLGTSQDWSWWPAAHALGERKTRSL